MSKIKLLDDLTIQQIAAGEVIERPASIVKELLENSLDANAKNIIIEIKNGGKTYIRITDDGDGIPEDQVSLAFKRHSTSKLTKADDLYNIQSLGFRGEALASIATVAKVNIMTKTEDAQAGVEANVANGEIINQAPVGTPKGTTIIVKDLFYNLPVRRDFLKSDLVESNRISDVVYKLALGNPQVNMRYIKDNQNLLTTSSGSNLINHIYNILGKDFANNMSRVDYNKNDIKIKGYISNNKLYRGNRSHQYIFINGRYIENKSIVEVIEREYRSVIPLNKFPAFILFIDLNPQEIDVNIHPTKQEVKFSKEDEVLAAVKEMINTSLFQDITIPQANFKKKENKVEEKPLLFHMLDNKTDNIEDEIPSNKEDTIEIKDLREDKSEDKPKFFFDEFDEKEDNKNYFNTKKENIKSKEIYNPEYFKKDKPNYFKEIKDNLDSLKEKNMDISKEKQYSKVAADNDNINKEAPSTNEELANINNLKPIGVLFKTYILAEDISRDLVFLIDQHAAHERIMYERYVNEFKEEKVFKQELLSPLVIELTAQEFSKVIENKDLLYNLGFDIDKFGQTDIIIRTVPLVFGHPNLKDAFYDILDQLESNVSSNYDTRVGKIMKIACVNSVKSGDSLSEQEILGLLEQLKDCKHPYSCPHGRPTMLKITRKDIEKGFLRIM